MNYKNNKMENYFLVFNKMDLKLRNLFGQLYSQLFQNINNLPNILQDIQNVLNNFRIDMSSNKTFILINKCIEKFNINIDLELYNLYILINQSNNNEISKYDFKKKGRNIILINLFKTLDHFKKDIFLLNEKYKKQINIKNIKEIYDLKNDFKNIF